MNKHTDQHAVKTAVEYALPAPSGWTLLLYAGKRDEMSLPVVAWGFTAGSGKCIPLVAGRQPESFLRSDRLVSPEGVVFLLNDEGQWNA